jgi:hypothetical protein
LLGVGGVCWVLFVIDVCVFSSGVFWVVRFFLFFCVEGLIVVVVVLDIIIVVVVTGVVVSFGESQNEQLKSLIFFGIWCRFLKQLLGISIVPSNSPGLMQEIC